MGLFDAYVLQQLEADNKLLAELAAMYILITTPKETWESALKKIMGESYVNIH